MFPAEDHFARERTLRFMSNKVSAGDRIRLSPCPLASSEIVTRGIPKRFPWKGMNPIRGILVAVGRGTVPDGVVHKRDRKERSLQLPVTSEGRMPREVCCIWRSARVCHPASGLPMLSRISLKRCRDRSDGFLSECSMAPGVRQPPLPSAHSVPRLNRSVTRAELPWLWRSISFES